MPKAVKKAVKKVVAKKPVSSERLLKDLDQISKLPARPQKPPRVLDPGFITQEELGLIGCMCSDLKDSHGITLRQIRAAVDQLIYETPGFEA